MMAEAQFLSNTLIVLKLNKSQPKNLGESSN
jgi:hypothetical protein